MRLRSPAHHDLAAGRCDHACEQAVLVIDDEEPAVAGDVAAVARPSMLTSGTIAVGALATLVLGIVPGPVLDLAAHAGQFVR